MFVITSLACGTGSAATGGGGGGDGMCSYDGVAYTVWLQDDVYYRFLDDHRVVMVWRNMVGDAVQATYKLRGDTVTIDIPEVKNYKRTQEVYRRLDGCSMARTQNSFANGEVHDELDGIYVAERKTPTCGCK